MKIFIHAHYYLPKTLAGAEKFLHEIAKALRQEGPSEGPNGRAGNEVIVGIDDDIDYEHEGIRIISNKKYGSYYWADAVITHLLNAEDAIKLAAQHNRPLYHLLHNNMPAASLKNNPENNFIVYNSEALKNELNLPLPSIIVHPPIDTKNWANSQNHYFNEYITLVNCCYEKGGEILKTLAEIMPGHRFMGVKGSYNPQIIQQSPNRNIQFMPVQTDMRNIYNQTRIIIMPSTYESWGMVASEAMASGIPVICTDTPGLRENCGDAAIYVERTASAFRKAIESLNDLETYQKHVLKGLQRDQINELDKLLSFMEKPLKEAENGEVEKVDYSEFKEKKEIKAKREKKEIKKPGKPGRPKKLLTHNSKL